VLAPAKLQAGETLGFHYVLYNNGEAAEAFAGNDKVGLLGNGFRGIAAGIMDGLPGLLAREIFERAGNDNGLSGQGTLCGCRNPLHLKMLL